MMSWRGWVFSEWVFDEWVFSEWVFDEWVFGEWILGIEVNEYLVILSEERLVNILIQPEKKLISSQLFERL